MKNKVKIEPNALKYILDITYWHTKAFTLTICLYIS